MHFKNRAAFSPNDKYFACISPDDKLLIWETANNAFIDCKFDSTLYSTCTSIHWIPLQHPSPKKAKIIRSCSFEIQLLAVGTSKGDILLYNVSSKNLFSHLVGRHSDAVNDMCFYSKTDSLYTCSSDKFIAIWNITSGKQKAKWKADDSPISSICIIDENNMLSSSTSILWWNISDKSIIKKFNGHSAEIFKLLAVNAVSLNSCYFLSAAISDVKINAWSLSSNECQTPVASFVLSDHPEDMDISKASSKDKPLILSVVTKDGIFHLFEHVLNGNLNQPIHPKVSIEIAAKSASSSILSVKLLPDTESCIIACGNNKEDLTFKHMKIKELLKESESINKTSNNSMSHDKFSVVKESSKSEKSLLVNGFNSPSKPLRNTAKKTQVDTVVSSYRRKLRSSTSLPPLTDSETLNLHETEGLKCIKKGRNCVKDISIKDPSSCMKMLLKGLETGDEEIINAVLRCNDAELIGKCVKSLPIHSLKLFLHELNNRLQHSENYIPTTSKWLKELFKVHLNFLIQSEDVAEVLHHIKVHMDSLQIRETLSQMSVLKGLISLQTQIAFEDEGDSESDEPMES